MRYTFAGCTRRTNRLGGLSPWSRFPLLVLIAVACCAGAPARAAETADDQATNSDPLTQWLEGKSLTGDWFGLGRQLSSAGVTVKLRATQVYQINLHGGQSTHRRAGRYAGSYDFQVNLDLEKLAGLPGASVCSYAKGSWSDGLDKSSVGSAVGGVNDDASGDYSIYLARLYYQQKLFDGMLQFRVGKLKLTGGFDCCDRCGTFDGSEYANDERTQFLNSALVNNPTIPFCKDGLGAIVHVEPVKWWYIGAGVADAQADKRETGFHTAFHGEDYFFSIYETGIVPEIPSANGPLPGAYRVGFWYDPQDKTTHAGGTKRDDMGFYLSFDQLLWREPGQDKGGSQGLGAFTRYGYAHSDVSDIQCFWSGGVQYEGLLPTRDDDVLGVGFAWGKLVQDAGFTRPDESVLEVYYNVAVTPWLGISPSFQYVWNPGGAAGVGDACVIGCRVQITI